MITRSLVFIVVLATSSWAMAADVKVGGYVEAEARWTDGGTGTPGVTVDDGALTFSGESGSSKAMVDIPFAGGSAVNNTLTLATGKAQAYVSHSYSNSFGWSLGQWDTKFGYDGNDDIDNTFTDAGLLAGFRPITHAGALVTYDIDKESYAYFSVAATGDQGAIAAGQNADYLGGYMCSTGDHRAGLNLLVNKAAAGTGFQADLVYKTNMEMLDLAGEVFYNKPAVGTSGVGFLVEGSSKVNDDLRAAARFELDSKVVSNSAIRVTAGPQFAMTKAMNVKFDYQLRSVTALAGGTAVTSHQLGLAANYRF